MKMIQYPANTRGSADHGWLKTKFSFSFANYWDDQRVHFGALRVLNDDFISGGQGFGMHPHDNMEIITIPLTGAVQHQDSTGGKGIITAGEVQIMSAGSGIYHSEMNASVTEPVTLFQIWIFPKEKNIAPRYDQKLFGIEGRKGKLQTLVSPTGKNDSLVINQSSWLSMIDLENENSFSYQLNDPSNGVYIMVVEGAVKITSDTEINLGKRDAAGLFELNEVKIFATQNASILFIEVPMEFSV